MIIGSGPIVIGQGCEFDYSGVQACKALRNEGYEILLVNSNPATIMTDPEFADRTYIEPLTFDSLHEIIRRERPDALLPTLGGQTALNLALQLSDARILQRYQLELIGANAEIIRRAEDRNEFKSIMQEIGLESPLSMSVHSLEEAIEAVNALGSWPVVVRPGFTLGGSGGGIAHNLDEFVRIVSGGLTASANHEVLIEESLLGWKEFELEVIRDKKNTSVIVCSIENIDPMGIHTGDSITVAPAQTLTDRQYQEMRTDSLRVMEAIGVETGGSNVQWAINPLDGRRIIIEMNPRVSRSSALASKATGFPIAKIAALLAVGYTLDELKNDITGSTPACFEPALDYVVTKMPRFTFEKFPLSEPILGTQMKSVGEAMAIGRTLTESFQKAIRSLETGRAGFGADGKVLPCDTMDDDSLRHTLCVAGPERIFAIRAALLRDWTIEELNRLTAIDPYFLRKMEQITRFECKLALIASQDARQVDSFRTEDAKTDGVTFSDSDLPLDADTLREAKELGFSDRQLAFMFSCEESQMRALRKRLGVVPIYGTVDTCAGEFTAPTPYYYSSWGQYDEPVRDACGKKKIMILGGGPNRIGQGIEFDYCCVHAAFALHAAGYETIMVNSNPETVSTDYDTSDRLYFEPLTLEDVLNIYEREQCDGVIVQFGGQTPLNLAQNLKKAGVNIIGTSPDDINAAEDRDDFKQLAERLGILQPSSGIAHNVDQALEITQRIGYPVLVRPSFVLGGRAMVIVYKEKYLRQYVEAAEAVSEGKPILIDRFLEDSIELDVDCVSDGEKAVIGAIMEHVELAGIHSGDSACSIPPRNLKPEILNTIRKHTLDLARGLHVKGLMNIQFAVHDDTIYILEVNPRASRTVPFVSKSIGIPLAKKAALCMVGKKLDELNFTKEVSIPYTTFKEAVFPFVKFPGVDVVLSPEMKSTGEVMGIDYNSGTAYLKSQLSAGNEIPVRGGVFISLRDEDKNAAVPMVRELVNLGFEIHATCGTATRLYDNDIPCHAVFRISSGRPNLLDLIAETRIQWIVNCPETGAASKVDEIRMRRGAIAAGIPITTTLSALATAIEGLKSNLDSERITVCSLQEYHRHVQTQ